MTKPSEDFNMAPLSWEGRRSSLAFSWDNMRRNSLSLSWDPMRRNSLSVSWDALRRNSWGALSSIMELPVMPLKGDFGDYDKVAEPVPSLMPVSDDSVSVDVQSTTSKESPDDDDELSHNGDCVPEIVKSFSDKQDPRQQRFKPFHEEKWNQRYKELLDFHREHGHCSVPHTYPKNAQLARWVKRQRRQYKLRIEGRASTMTLERLDMLNDVGFIWDSHDVNWREKLMELEAFRAKNAHCNVPSNHSEKKLATWVKCQRRQYKLYWDGKPSAMTPERILQLEKIGFEWEIRSPTTKDVDHGDYALLYETISEL